MSDVARIFAPLLIWLALFSGLYGLHGLGCGLGWPGVPLGPLTVHRAVLLAAGIGAVLVQAAVLLALTGPLRSPRTFVRQVSLTLAVAGVAAMVWTVLPVGFVSSCG